jgi:hypothetical protein
MDKVHVGSRVRHNNLICIVTKIKGSDCELQPVGSNSRYSAPISTVTVIMNEGTNESDISSALYD